MIWKNYKGVIITLVFVGFLILTYVFVIERLVSEIEGKRNKLQELATIQEGQRKRLSNIPEFKKNAAVLEEAEKKMHPFLKKDKAVELIQEVERLAESTGNKVIIEVAGTDAPAKTTAKNATETIISNLPIKEYIQLRIRITGSFFGFLKFLNRLENSDYYLDVTSLQMSRNQDQTSPVPAETVAKNPFNQSSGSKDAGSGNPEENAQETVSLINVVVYTQN